MLTGKRNGDSPGFSYVVCYEGHWPSIPISLIARERGYPKLKELETPSQIICRRCQCCETDIAHRRHGHAWRLFCWRLAGIPTMWGGDNGVSIVPSNLLLSKNKMDGGRKAFYRLMLSNKLFRLFSSVIRTSRGFAPCAAPTIPIRSIWSIRRPARL